MFSYFSKSCIAFSLSVFLSSSVVHAHFLEVIPSSDIVEAPNQNPVTLDISFTHPMMQGPMMDMAKPVVFDVINTTGRESLLGQLELKKASNQSRFYQTQYQIKAPSDQVFYLEPTPYWEPAEGAMIIHYTKVVVDGFNGDALWDSLVGAPVEIQPLTRPYGLWTGNLFSGVVMKQGKPVPFAEVEVEWRNDGSVKVAYDSYSTQVVKADNQGVFHYAMPTSGWWGFAALVTADAPMENPEGKMVPVEEGGLIWVYTRDMK